jgi:hypothetical protein
MISLQTSIHTINQYYQLFVMKMFHPKLNETTFELSHHIWLDHSKHYSFYFVIRLSI